MSKYSTGLTESIVPSGYRSFGEILIITLSSDISFVSLFPLTINSQILRAKLRDNASSNEKFEYNMSELLDMDWQKQLGLDFDKFTSVRFFQNVHVTEINDKLLKLNEHLQKINLYMSLVCSWKKNISSNHKTGTVICYDIYKIVPLRHIFHNMVKIYQSCIIHVTTVNQDNTDQRLKDESYALDIITLSESVRIKPSKKSFFENAFIPKLNVFLGLLENPIAFEFLKVDSGKHKSRISTNGMSGVIIHSNFIQYIQGLHTFDVVIYECNSGSDRTDSETMEYEASNLKAESVFFVNYWVKLEMDIFWIYKI